jgi:hypothetical protein
LVDAAGADFLAVVVERDCAALAHAATVIGELHMHLGLAVRYGRRGVDAERLDA